MLTRETIEFLFDALDDKEYIIYKDLNESEICTEEETKLKERLNNARIELAAMSEKERGDKPLKLGKGFISVDIDNEVQNEIENYIDNLQ